MRNLGYLLTMAQDPVYDLRYLRSPIRTKWQHYKEGTYCAPAFDLGDDLREIKVNLASLSKILGDRTSPSSPAIFCEIATGSGSAAALESIQLAPGHKVLASARDAERWSEYLAREATRSNAA